MIDKPQQTEGQQERPAQENAEDAGNGATAILPYYTLQNPIDDLVQQIFGLAAVAVQHSITVPGMRQFMRQNRLHSHIAEQWQSSCADIEHITTRKSPPNCKLCTGSQHDSLGNARSDSLSDLVQGCHQRGEAFTRDADAFATPMWPDACQNQRKENAAD